MISLKNGKGKITGKCDEIMNDIFGILADPQILKISLEFKEVVGKLDKTANFAAELGKLLGETEEGSKLVKRFEVRKELANFLSNTIMEALRLKGEIDKC